MRRAEVANAAGTRGRSKTIWHRKEGEDSHNKGGRVHPKAGEGHGGGWIRWARKKRSDREREGERGRMAEPKETENKQKRHKKWTSTQSWCFVLFCIFNTNSQIIKAKTLTQHDEAPHLKITRSSTSYYFVFPQPVSPPPFNYWHGGTFALRKAIIRELFQRVQPIGMD